LISSVKNTLWCRSIEYYISFQLMQKFRNAGAMLCPCPSESSTAMPPNPTAHIYHSSHIGIHTLCTTHSRNKTSPANRIYPSILISTHISHPHQIRKAIKEKSTDTKERNPQTNPFTTPNQSAQPHSPPSKPPTRDKSARPSKAI
jgi:hypothetical protein